MFQNIIPLNLLTCLFKSLKCKDIINNCSRSFLKYYNILFFKEHPLILQKTYSPFHMQSKIFWDLLYFSLKCMVVYYTSMFSLSVLLHLLIWSHDCRIYLRLFSHVNIAYMILEVSLKTYILVKICHVIG